jgi:hypothetical protein
MAAFKRQQARWATGAAQCLVKLAGSLWRGRPYPGPVERDHEGSPPIAWPARLEALLHLSVWIAYPMSVILLFLTLPLLLGQISLTFNLTIFWLVALGPMVAYALSQRHLYLDWKRRMAYMPVLALLGTGMAFSNTIAIAKGLLGKSLPFRRTPKFHIERRGDRWVGSRYVLPFQWATVGELFLAGYALLAVATALFVGNYFAVPFLLLYVGGYGYISLHGIRDIWAGRRVRARARRRPAMANWRLK